MLQCGGTTHSPCVTLCNKNHFSCTGHAEVRRREGATSAAASSVTRSAGAALLLRLAFSGWPRNARPPEWTPRPALAPSPIPAWPCCGRRGASARIIRTDSMLSSASLPVSRALRRPQSRPDRIAPAPRSTAGRRHTGLVGRDLDDLFQRDHPLGDQVALADAAALGGQHQSPWPRRRHRRPPAGCHSSGTAACRRRRRR